MKLAGVAPHPGLAAAAAIAGLVAVSLAGLASAGGSGDLASLWPHLQRTIWSAARQAALSTLLSLLLGAALALALARRSAMPGRRLLQALLAAAMVAPTIVIVFGIVAVYGRAGPVNQAASWLGLPPLPSIYGLHGIVLAHVVMNAPLAARVFLAALAAIPPERGRLAHMLRFSPLDCFRHLDWPALRRELPGLGGLIFLLCFTSFAVVISLGGGPRNATLEAAIYEALRLEADFARAAGIAAVQIALCVAFVAALSLAGGRFPDSAGAARPMARPDRESRPLLWLDVAAIGVALALVAPIMLAVLPGAQRLPSLLAPDIGRAALASLLIAAMAAALAVTLGLLLASAAASAPLGRPSPGRARIVEATVLALVALPPFALVAGLFVLLRGFGGLSTLGLALVPLVNALMALPFVFRLLASPLRASAERHGRLAASLGIGGLDHARIVAWPLLRRPLAAAAALAAALSMGDFGVIALFGGGDLITLPYLMVERMGAYRMDEAGAVALLLVAIAGALAFGADRMVRDA